MRECPFKLRIPWTVASRYNHSMKFTFLRGSQCNRTFCREYLSRKFTFYRHSGKFAEFLYRFFRSPCMLGTKLGTSTLGNMHFLCPSVVCKDLTSKMIHFYAKC